MKITQIIPRSEMTVMYLKSTMNVISTVMSNQRLDHTYDIDTKQSSFLS